MMWDRIPVFSVFAIIFYLSGSAVPPTLIKFIGSRALENVKGNDVNGAGFYSLYVMHESIGVPCGYSAVR